MKTYKKGISLIVLVITVIVLAILATTVIISLSDTNIISQARETVFKSDMTNFKTAYEFYLASKLIEDRDYEKTSLNLSATSDATKFNEIFGEEVSDKHKDNLEIVAGRLVYKTVEPEFVAILKELDMEITVIPATLAIGDLVEYTPTANPSGTYSGATYAKDTITTSATYNTYIEKTIDTYTPGTLTWVYLGQDENGNVLLTSQEATSFEVTIAGQDGWVTGPDRIDTLCNTLYGNSKYGTARNMKIEDVNRTLGYPGETGYLGRYFDKSGGQVNTLSPKTVRELETELRITISNRKKARLSATAFDDYLSNFYTYTGVTYKESATNEFRVIFKKVDGTDQPVYWLSSPAMYVRFEQNLAYFRIRIIKATAIESHSAFYSNGYEDASSAALRPVIVLKSNIQFGEKNSSGAFTLVEM